MPRTPRYWTREEDEILRKGIDECNGRGSSVDWCGIAANLPGRTNKDCRKRWHNAVAEGINKGQWTKAEDELLKKGVSEYGQKKWPLVAEVVKNRSADQCAKRWQQSLNPELDRSEWTDQDNDILLDAVTKIGRHWTHIQRLHFPERSKNAIKNRYSVITRRLQKQNSIDLGFNPGGAFGKNKESSPRDGFSSDGDRDEDSSSDTSDESGKAVEQTADPASLVLHPDTNAMDWLHYDNSWNVEAHGNLTHAFNALDPTGTGSSPSIGDLSGSSSSKFASPWETSPPGPSGPSGPSCPLPTDLFSPSDIMGHGDGTLDIGPLEQSLPSSGQLQEQETVHFHLTMTRPSVSTMQQLMKIAIETQSRFRVERE